MERLSIQELAAVLVTKSGLKKKDAERFASVMFEVVKDGLAEDRQVKIKGLGTFKVIDIDSRESVDVNTGERVLIEGHDKITFTPDATMKEIVNKPFSQFETVVLNDGVEFDDMDLSDVEEPVVEEPVVEEPVVEEPVAEEFIPVIEDAPILDFIENQEEETTNEIDETNDTENQDQEMEENDKKTRHRVAWVIVAIAACVGSFAAGYYIARQSSFMADENIEIAESPEDTVKTDSGATDAVAKKDTAVVEVKKDTVVAVKKDTAVAVKKEAPAETVSEAADKYSQMDARVRTGAYRIVGTAQEVKVKAGETLKRIASHYLGPDMECYVEVYNGLKPDATLKEGQTLKIPKLELKKKKKQQTKQ